MYPLSLNVRGRRVVVVGGGNVAERKIGMLLEAGANVRVVSPSLTRALEELASQHRIEWSKKPFEVGDLDDAFLAFAATSDDAVNAATVEAARTRGILVNDAGRAERGDFFTPAIHRRDSLTIAIDTGGTAPAVAKLLREQIGAVVEHCLSGSLVCASRASALAMIQTRGVMAKLARCGIASTVITLTTKGDEVQDRSLASIGTDSVFVRELELALRERRADYAVHSCKDLPSTLPDDMEIVAIVERADRRDVFCSERYAGFGDVPPGGVIGTSSPRRTAQLGAMRPDLNYRTIRGNVDTRLRKLRAGEYDAIVLAAAGLDRLSLQASYSIPFPPDVLVPAVAQGALAVETLRGDPAGALLRAALNDADCELEVLAERAFLRAMRGGCQAPIGATGTLDAADRSMLLRAAVGLAGGGIARSERRANVRTAEEAEALGTALAAELGMASLERTT
jgi:hydroxymethylbilane synthase